ncbi:DUF2188 domain-containing protein [Paraliobacillus salinarum]|uniref:DUF2188 domain-containing protein n=1 Tax=Paraliobacillus salinarum TaxID=1158996 RepID=UPI0015F35B49|nr:DUF2188 domain-containing protein [Paraliobacillus salinarum]
MPWDTTDYPSSLKHLDTAVRKKAISIANAMVNEGYSESQAIPIATAQAKEWHKNASEKERNSVLQSSDESLIERDREPENARPELMKKGEHVVPHKDGWAVKTQAAKVPSNVYTNKNDAINRAKEIAKNKKTSVIVHFKNGQLEYRHDYSK